MKTVAIDARLYSQTGVGTYLRNLIRELGQFETPGMRFILYVLPEDRGKIPEMGEKFAVREAPCKWHTVSEQTQFLRIIRQDPADLFHFTYFGYPVFYPGRFVATVHDLTPLLFRTGKASTRNPVYYAVKHFFFTRVLDAQVQGARSIITPTLAVKEQLAARYGEAVSRKTVPIYEGVGYELREGQENKALAGEFSDPFFVYVGNFYPHKNVERLVRAFASSGVKQKLVLVGPQDYFSRSVAALAKELGVEGRVRFFHKVTVGDLIYFYRHAAALVHPSLSEGFGLPLVEAAHFGLPIIASDIPVIRELLGSSYLAFDPLDAGDMRAKLEEFAGNPAKADYGGFGEKYSFAKMARATLEVYRQNLTD